MLQLVCKLKVNFLMLVSNDSIEERVCPYSFLFCQNLNEALSTLSVSIQFGRTLLIPEVA